MKSHEIGQFSMRSPYGFVADHRPVQGPEPPGRDAPADGAAGDGFGSSPRMMP